MNINPVRHLVFRFGQRVSSCALVTPPLASNGRLLSLASTQFLPVDISVAPQEALLDSPPHIQVKGLRERQKVTLWNTFTDDSGIEFSSHAHYIANSNGEIDLKHHMSMGGNYEGIFSEGLISTMQTPTHFYAQQKHLKWARPFKNDVTNPMNYSLKLLDGHVGEKEIYSKNSATPLADKKFIRHLMSEGVQRQEVVEGKLRGIMFTPAGDGPFPMILDLPGLDSGSREFRSAMLASYGFASLVLPYSDYKDLPKISNEIDMEYFLSAVEFLHSHPKSSKGAIGLIGSNKGGEIGIMLSTLTDKIAALIAINAACNSVNVRFRMKGETCLEMYEADPDKCNSEVDKNGVFNCSAPDSFYMWDSKYSLPIEKSHDDCHILVASGDDDGGCSYRSCNVIRDRAERYRKVNVSALTYSGAGHLLDPPFHSHIYAGWDSTINIRRVRSDTKDAQLPNKYGGYPFETMLAAKDLWSRTLALFHKRLVLDAGLDIEKVKFYPPYAA